MFLTGFKSGVASLSSKATPDFLPQLQRRRFLIPLSLRPCPIRSAFFSSWLNHALHYSDGNQLGSMYNVEVSAMITARSMTFCSSRILPGHEYDRSRSTLFLSMPRISFPIC